MNCQDFEQRIYLYDELTFAERETVDNHMLNCASCKKIREQGRWQQSLVREAATQSVEARNPGKITQHVMRTIQSEKGAGWNIQILNYIDSLWMRSALAAVSVFLILFFLFEQQWGESIPATANKTFNRRDGMVLKASRFPEIHKNGGTGIRQAPITSLYECMKKNDCNDAFRKFNKLIKYYENI